MKPLELEEAAKQLQQYVLVLALNTYDVVPTKWEYVHGNRITALIDGVERVFYVINEYPVLLPEEADILPRK